MLVTSQAGVGLVLAGVGGLGMIALLVLVGTRLFSSAHSADAHLVRGIALAPRESSVAGALGAHVAPSPDGATAGDGASQQFFAQLNEYYAANISQGKTIFWASLLSMCIGFAIVFAGVVLAGVNGITAIVAAIAGVLSQFIAATFLVVLRSTQQQATAYAQGLVELHLRDVARTADARAVTLGLQLLGEINGDRTNPANPTKAAIAMGLIVKQPAILETSGAAPVDIGTTRAPNAQQRGRTATITFDDAPAAEKR